MKFAQRVLRIAGIYGLVILIPQYFLEIRIGIDHPPPITHPEFYYGFLGVAIAWQLAFLLMAQAPQRYRLILIPSIIEKFSFAAAGAVLFLQGRMASIVLVFASIDLICVLLFIEVYRRLLREQRSTFSEETQSTGSV